MKLGDYELPDLPEGYSYVMLPAFMSATSGGAHYMEIKHVKTGLPVVHFWRCATEREQYDWCNFWTGDELLNWHRVGPRIGRIILREVTKHRLGLRNE
jgi:hypothetical protein